MLFSVLVCNIPFRRNDCSKLLAYLEKISKGYDVEILCLYDNKQRTVGQKRNDLLKLAQGDYIAFIDDDDDVDNDYFKDICEVLERDRPDVLTFTQLTIFKDTDRIQECKYSVEYDYESGEDWWRGKPSHTMVWRRAIALKGKFPEVQNTEDVAWVDQVVPYVQKESNIDKPLYMYRFNPAKSEAISKEEIIRRKLNNKEYCGEVCVVGMIYKSVNYLKFMSEQMRKYCAQVSCGIIANDATEEVKHELMAFPGWVLEYNDPNPDDYYLNRVYRAWNAGGMYCKDKHDIVIFINSDMGLSSNWINKLLDGLAYNTIPCSRLVESGKLPSGEHAIVKDFGGHPNEYREEEFVKYANSLNKFEILNNGLYMPCAFWVEDFISSGGYPEGNVENRSGDEWFFNENSVMKRKKHVTVAHSVVYHIQEGEKDE